MLTSRSKQCLHWNVTRRPQQNFSAHNIQSSFHIYPTSKLLIPPPRPAQQQETKCARGSATHGVRAHHAKPTTPTRPAGQTIAGFPVRTGLPRPPARRARICTFFSMLAWNGRATGRTCDSHFVAKRESAPREHRRGMGSPVDGAVCLHRMCKQGIP